MNAKFTVQDIVESSLFIALAIVFDLDGLKIPVGGNGGSISFTMIPLILLALRVGPIKGFIGIGVIYGVITCLVDGYNFITYPLDYLLAYGSIAIFGFFSKFIFDKEKPIKGVLFVILSSCISFTLRFIFHTLSGVIVFESSLLGSMAYNAVYVFVSGGVSLVILLLLYKPLEIVFNRFPNKKH